MKNIHVLPTEKPSKLGYISEIKSYHIFTNGENPNNIADNLANYRNIYITSDEEIKEGDWVLYGEETVMQVKSSYDNDMSGEDIWLGDSLNGLATNKDNCKKITLTTDQDLIKDGVQAIDDEFLEWFVKNPSCESVEVKKFFGFAEDYLIIIPKEEPKQETLEEAAERFYPETEQWTDRHIFNLGAKWQAERMYSDIELFTEELKDKIDSFEHSVNQNSYISDYIKEWFEQFKK